MPTFQRTMEHLLRGLVGTSCLCFPDDILINSATFEQHLKNVDQVLERIQTAGMTLRLDKCRFFDREVEYLGHLMGDGVNVCTDKEVEEAMKSFPRPTAGGYRGAIFPRDSELLPANKLRIFR